MKKAFSVLEIIFVVVIIGIIAMLAMPKLGSISSDAKANTIKQDIYTLKSNLQSYYMVNQKIDKISDVVSLNSKIWSIEDKKTVFKENDKDCITLEIVNQTIKLTVNKSAGKVCEKIENSGVTSETIELN
ncbi:MAG: prepilin-type N-terminal cleavage/methylation domain-containing protein [Arcobacteraceae bacterium]